MWVDASGTICDECDRTRVDWMFGLFWYVNYNEGGFKVGWKSVSGRIWKSMCFHVNFIYHSTNILEHALIFLKSIINKHEIMNLMSLNKKSNVC